MLARVFPKNEHAVERIVRIVAGLAILSLTVVGPQSLWGLVGLVFLVTGVVGTCPLYTLFGVSTCKMADQPGNGG